MKQSYLRGWMFLLVMVMLLVACGGDGEVSFSTANIRSATLARDQEGTQKTTAFAPGDTFFAIVELANAPDDTSVKASWTAVNAEGEAPNVFLDEVEYSTSSGTVFFELSNTGPWPPGEYKVDLYLNDELDQTLAFQVRAPFGQTESTEEDTAVAEPDDTAPVAAAVTSLEDVRMATIRIQAQGSFVDPEVGLMLNTAGQGTGFIIDPAGIAVTNNHVVTGAALLEVWVEGEDGPRNAKILGVSECSDLAVIDIDGEGFPYLDWFEGDLKVGLDVYGAGFPLFGNTEYTLTRGIISKEQANGDTSWASVDSVIEHDATINPGNSGGPLVNSDGHIIGVNYAGNFETNQYFAIARDQARQVIAQLREGQDVHSIGINGQAVSDGESLFGIWVSSVKSGSPADQAGIKGGDILTSLEGLVLATDGTMASYCDILRSRNPEDTMSIEVLRFNTQEMLEGQLNGRELEVAFSFTEELGEEVADQGSGGAYSSYTTVTDDSGLLSVEIPANWAQVDGSGWTLDGEVIGLSVMAAPDLNGYLSTWTTPGVAFRASSDLNVTEQELLEAFDYSGDCEYGGREDYADQLYAGQYDVWRNCGNQGAVYVVLTAVPEGREFIILVEVQIVSDADLEAFDRILNSFVVNTQ